MDDPAGNVEHCVLSVVHAWTPHYPAEDEFRNLVDSVYQEVGRQGRHARVRTSKLIG